MMPAVGAARFRLGVGLVFAVALALRVAHAVAVQGSILRDLALGDAAVYLAWARTIASGDWLGSGVFYQAPLYPYTLALFQLAFGEGRTVLLIGQAVLGSLACAVLVLAGESWFDRRVGLVAGLLLAVYGPAIFFDGIVQKSVLDTLLVALLFRTLALRTPKTSLGAGIVSGLLALTRENTLLLAPLSLGWLAWPKGRTRAALFIAGLALPLAPVLLRNYAVGGELHLTTSQAGTNFWIGNHRGASGLYEPLVFSRGDAAVEASDAKAIAAKALGHEPTPGEVSRYWLARARDDIAADPLAWVRLLGKKAAMAVNAVEWSDTEDLYTYGEVSPVLRVASSVAHFGIVAALAGVGLVVSRRRLREIWFLPAWSLAYGATVVLFFVASRYRHPLAPALCLFAAAGVVDIIRTWRERSLRERLVLAGVLATLLVAFNFPLGNRDAMRSTTWTNIGIARAADPAAARAAYERALELDVTSVRANVNLANLLLEENPARSLALYDAALERAPSIAFLWYNRGNALLRLGRADEAVAANERAVALEPNRSTLIGLALAQRAAGRRDEALATVERLLALQPNDEAALRLRAMLRGPG
jgi:4-amino-4-deoxy-L-arabinose transferase-like glycosyltransferase